MKGKIVNVLFGICACAFVLSAGTAAAVYAGAEEAASPVLTMKEGASVRFFEPTGIRFVTEISAEDYAEIIDADENAEFGTLIIPTEVLGNTQITAENYKKLDAELIVTETWLADTETTKSYAGALVGTETSDGNYENFPEEFYDCELTAVSYCAYARKVIFAENPQRYSMAYTASALLAEGAEDEFLSKIVGSVLAEGLSFDAESYTLTVGETAETALMSGGAEVTLKAVYESDSEAVAVDENGTLTAKAAGSATITAMIGNKTAQTAVTVAEKGMVLDFSSAADAPTGGDVTEADWLDSYEGATGVLKMHVGVWKGYTNTSEWKPIFDSSDYSGYTHLAFRVKVEGFTGNNFKFYYKVEGTNGETAVQYEIELTADTDGWTTVYLPIETFVNNFDGYTQKTQLLFLNNPESNDTQTYLYLDSIRAVNKISIDDMAVKVGESVDFKDIAEFSGATGLTVEVGGVLQNGTVFAPAAAGEYTVSLTGEIDGKYSCAEFILRAAEEGMLFDFSANGDRPTGNDVSGLCELLSEFEGADGVLKLEASSNWPVYSYNGALKPIFDKAVYQGYEYLEFRVYATGVLNLYFQVDGTSPVIEYMLQFGNGNLDINQWVTYRLSIDTFLNNYESFLQSGQFLTVADGVAPEADSTYVYIDYIRAVNTTE